MDTSAREVMFHPANTMANVAKIQGSNSSMAAMPAIMVASSTNITPLPFEAGSGPHATLECESIQVDFPYQETLILCPATSTLTSKQIYLRKLVKFHDPLLNQANCMLSQKNAIHANWRDSPLVWFPPLVPGWKQALLCIESFAYGDKENWCLVYPLPPIHLFHKSKNEKMGEKIHNWLWVRLWYLIQVITPPEHQMVSMRTSQWRIALEGCYYAVKYQWPKGVRPQALSSDIDRLPSPPPIIKKAWLDSIPVCTLAQVHT